VISVFIDSLSRSKRHGIAVILSGCDDDGSAAIAALGKRGGLVIVQDPVTAERPEMPRAAIETGHVDYVLPPKGIAEELEKISVRWKQSISSEVEKGFDECRCELGQ
jgi:two-component system, chemotaxis family, CheB/CheR fusion protein